MSKNRKILNALIIAFTFFTLKSCNNSSNKLTTSSQKPDKKLYKSSAAKVIKESVIIADPKNDYLTKDAKGNIRLDNVYKEFKEVDEKWSKIYKKYDQQIADEEFPERKKLLNELRQVKINTLMIAIEKGDLSVLKKCVLASNPISIDASIVDKNNNSIWHKLALCKNNTKEVCNIFSGQPVFYEENSDKPILDDKYTPRKYHLDPKYSQSKPFYYSYYGDYQNNDGYTPLIMAAQNDNPIALNFFIEQGTTVPRYFKEKDYAQGDCIAIIYDALKKQERLIKYQKDYANMVNTNPAMYSLFEIIEQHNYSYLTPKEEHKKAEIAKLFDSLDIKLRNKLGHSLFEILITRIDILLRIDAILYGRYKINGVESVNELLSTLKLIYSKAFLNDKSFRSCNKNLKSEISHQDAPTNIAQAFKYILSKEVINKILSVPPPCTKDIKINTLKILGILGANKYYINKRIQEIN